MPLLPVAQVGQIKPNRFSIAAYPITKRKDKRDLFSPSERAGNPSPPLQNN